MANPLIPKKGNNSHAVDVPHSAGILDDFAVRKNVATKEGTIEKVPVNNSDIVNKVYSDTRRVKTIADATTFAPDVSNYDINHQVNTQGAGNLTMSNPTGSPKDCQPMIIKIKSSAVQTFVWDTQYRGGTMALPTTSTGASKTDYYSFIFNTADTKWDYTGSAVNF